MTSQKKLTENHPLYGRYEEVVFAESNYDAYYRVSTLISEVDQVVPQSGCSPCFATVLPMTLRAWNQTRISQNRTYKLVYKPQYESMQRELETTVSQINHYINQTNISNQMATPQLADIVATHFQNQFRYHYGRFADGVHLKHKFNVKCINKTIKCINYNTQRVHY